MKEYSEKLKNNTKAAKKERQACQMLPTVLILLVLIHIIIKIINSMYYEYY